MKGTLPFSLLLGEGAERSEADVGLPAAAGLLPAEPTSVTLRVTAFSQEKPFGADGNLTFREEPNFLAVSR